MSQRSNILPSIPGSSRRGPAKTFMENVSNRLKWIRVAACLPAECFNATAEGTARLHSVTGGYSSCLQTRYLFDSTVFYSHLSANRSEITIELKLIKRKIRFREWRERRFVQRGRISFRLLIHDERILFQSKRSQSLLRAWAHETVREAETDARERVDPRWRGA